MTARTYFWCFFLSFPVYVPGKIVKSTPALEQETGSEKIQTNDSQNFNPQYPVNFDSQDLATKGVTAIVCGFQLMVIKLISGRYFFLNFLFSPIVNNNGQISGHIARKESCTLLQAQKPVLKTFSYTTVVQNLRVESRRKIVNVLHAGTCKMPRNSAQLMTNNCKLILKHLSGCLPFPFSLEILFRFINWEVFKTLVFGCLMLLVVCWSIQVKSSNFL